METNRIRQFIALVQTRHLRKAADLMKISHGAFHKSIQVLEEEIGDKLYSTHGKTLIITPQGQMFYERAAEFLRAEQVFLQRKESTTRFLIGTHETFSTYLLGPYWQKYFPDTPLNCYEISPGRLEEAIAMDKIDVGLTHSLIPRDGIDYIRMGKIRMGVYGLRDFKKVDFEHLPFVVPITPLDSIPTAARGLDAWPERDFPRKIMYRMDTLTSAMQLVDAGLCVIFIPHFVAKVYNTNRIPTHQFHEIPLPKSFKPVHRDVFLIQRLGGHESPEIRQLAKLVRSEYTDKV